MVSADDILSMEFLKMTEFTGSSDGLRYRMECKVTEEPAGENEEPKKVKTLLCTIWPEPFNFHTTPEEQKERKEFSFDRDGVTDAVAWINDRLFEEPEKWAGAASNWDSYRLPKV